MADFGAIIIKDIEGNDDTINVRRDLGNALYYQSTDVAGSELGQKIYHSDGEIELSAEEKELVTAIVPKIYPSYVARQAIIDAINK